MNEQSGQNLSEEPQEERGAVGSRDTGADTAAGGSTGRESGDLDQRETTSVSEEDEESRTTFTTAPPGEGTESAVPPYEGRKETANPESDTATGEVGGADVGGATSPASTDAPDEPAPASTPGGQYASPAAEEPVGSGEDLADDAGGVGAPTHTGGVERGEDQR